MLYLDLLHVSILTLASHLSLPLFLKFCLLTKGCLFVFPLLSLFDFMRSSIDGTNCIDAEGNGIRVQLLQQAMHQALLPLFRCCEWVCFERVKICFTSAWNHNLRVALIMTDRHHIFKRHELESPHLTWCFVFHVGHLLLLLTRVFPDLDLVTDRDTKASSVREIRRNRSRWCEVIIETLVSVSDVPDFHP